MEEKFESIGFKVEPPFQEGQSPYLAQFTITCGTIATAYDVDFMDGSHPESGVFILEGNLEDGYKVATIEHEYTYLKGKSKYSGHSFYPKITIYGNGPDGEKIINEFNTEKTGRCLSIIVNNTVPQS